jgi:tetratricopeptide (TPR) repeat protein
MAGPVKWKPNGYLDRVLQARGIIEGPSPETWYDRLEREETELERALEAACKDDPALGLRTAPFLQRFWFARGRLERGRKWVERLLAAAGDQPTPERGQGLFAAAALAFRQGQNDVSRRYALEALDIARQFEAPELEMDAELALSRIGLRDRDLDNLRRYAEDARKVARQLGDEARELSAIHVLAEAARMGGDYRLARTLYDESLARNRARGNRLMVAVELVNLAFVDKTEGNLGRAEENLREAVLISVELHNSYVQAATLVALAAVATSAEQPQRAARLLGRADAIYSATGLVVDPADKPEYEGALAAARAQLGKDKFEAAYVEGARSTAEELIR